MSERLKATIDARARNIEAVRLECKGLANELAELCAKDERAMHAVIALRVRLASMAADVCGILADTAAGRMTGQAELPVLAERLELHPAQREKMRQSLRRVADDSLEEEPAPSHAHGN